MKIFTSYFANLKKIINPISICGKAPLFYKGPQYKRLAPKYGFFMDWKQGKLDNDGYVRCFKEQVLKYLNHEQVLEDLQNFYEGQDVVTLICYEKPGDFCHRHLVADWLKEAGIEVEEMSKV